MADERLIERSVGRSQVIFDPQGSRITKLILDDHLVSETVTRGDGKDANWHPCGPNFDEDPRGILPKHGSLRNTLAEILPLRPGHNPASIRTRALINIEGYPEVEVIRVLTLSDKALKAETWYANMSDSPAVINHGEHLYLVSPHGWEQAMLNGHPLAESIKGDQIFRWSDINRVRNHSQRDILISHEGLPFANPWTGQDQAGNFDLHYFSLSAVQGYPKGDYLGSPRSILLPRSITATPTKLVVSIF